jgi:hypothetical protein
VPVTAFQANETLHDVLPVTLRLNDPVGGFGGLFASDADSGEPGATRDRAVSFWHPAAASRIDPASTYETELRNVNMVRPPWVWSSDVAVISIRERTENGRRHVVGWIAR